MDNYSYSMHISAKPPPRPDMVEYQLVIRSDVSLPTTHTPPAILNLGKNFRFSDTVYIEPTDLIAATHLSKSFK